MFRNLIYTKSNKQFKERENGAIRRVWASCCGAGLALYAGRICSAGKKFSLIFFHSLRFTYSIGGVRIAGQIVLAQHKRNAGWYPSCFYLISVSGQYCPNYRLVLEE
jgi:hypothetical protein